MPLPALDHIIILLPHSVLHSLPRSLTSRLNVSPGGRHADGLTENKLIILPDGVYIELIAFLPDVSPERREQHWWGTLPSGIIDFALTSADVRDVEVVKQRLQQLKSDVTFAAPKAGSRKRDDGVEVKWEVTFPTLSTQASTSSVSKQNLQRGSVPFWCHDVTEREFRVPVQSEQAKTHPSGVQGVKEVVLGVPSDRLELFRSMFEAIAGESEQRDGQFRLATPFGEDARITLRGFDEKEARVVSLQFRAVQDSSAMYDAFETDKKVEIEFVQ